MERVSGILFRYNIFLSVVVRILENHLRVRRCASSCDHATYHAFRTFYTLLYIKYESGNFRYELFIKTYLY